MNERIAQAIALQRQGRLAEAAAACDTILEEEGERGEALHLLGVVRLRQGQAEAAAGLLERAIRCDPQMAEAHYHLAHAERRRGRHEAVVASYRRALQLRPDFAEALFNLGNALRHLGRREEALESYRRFLALRPEVAAAHHEVANLLKELSRWDEALRSYRRCIALQPEMAAAHFNLGVTLRRLRRDEEAVLSYQRAVELRPDLALAHNNLGAALRALHRPEQALACFERAVEHAPELAEAHDNLGAALNDLGRPAEALAHHREALRLRPEMADAHYNLGAALAQLARDEEALAAFCAALALRPDHVKAEFGVVQLLWHTGRFDEITVRLERVLALDPDYPHAFGALAFARRVVCDWSRLEEERRTLLQQVRAGRSQVRPFPFLAFSDDPAEQLLCAQSYLRERFALTPAPLGRLPRRGDGRIRLGYFSADLRTNPVSLLMAELFELHDRSRFDVLAFSLGPDEGSALRRRLERAFDEFHQIGGMGFREAAERVAAAGVDVLVDLNGYSPRGRPLILTYRPAPVQVSYLGFPATVGAPFIDYILVDDFVVPSGEQPHFTEQLVHLPECYLVNDRKRVIDEVPPSRGECGLPEPGFVFCAFNQNYKITPEMFSVWMRLLQAVRGSVLWLTRYEPAISNLRREAAARGVEPDRLVFAPFAPQASQHLARHRHADLFLDTLPYNAHSTASDALWAGLPVLTCAGRSFASRIPGSLLRALGLPELITTSLDEYEALALALARDPARLGALRERLAQGRTTMPLFATDRRCRDLERAYLEMWRRCESGEPPAPFAVPAEPAGG